ncbi:MAG: hypothetical protein CMP51_03770 [Flavobacteriales bacterium]|nr:hypothetical protein [Flavobacteriales bacterium]|tara:strand:- start:5275 stop:5583 length:309 start_codon:yes stop_codon:yes gene_type:complete
MILKGKNNLLNQSFFEQGGISTNAFFIFYIAFLLSMVILIPRWNHILNSKIKVSEDHIYNLQMEAKESEIILMRYYKRSNFLKHVDHLDLKFSDDVPEFIKN